MAVGELCKGTRKKNYPIKLDYSVNFSNQLRRDTESRRREPPLKEYTLDPATVIMIDFPVGSGVSALK